MKVLLLNGSPRANGCTARALIEVEKTLVSEGLEAEIVHIGNQPARGCIACGSCSKTKKCVFDDIVNELAKKFEEADGLIIGTPVYYAGSNGTLLALLDRLFYSAKFDKSMKVGASVISSRRAGSTSAFDEINKYFTICNMPIVASTYWNEVHGSTAEDVELDLEGLQTMRNLARNTAFLIRSIHLGKEQFGLPEIERGARTNFIDSRR